MAYENNNSGDIIGRFRPTTPKAKTGWFLIHKGRFYDLNRLIEKSNEEIMAVKGFSNKGVILATAFREREDGKGKEWHECLLVPE